MTSSLETTGARLLWRQHPTRPGLYHAMARVRRGHYVSICGDLERTRAGGSLVERPHPLARCPRCDVAEIALHRAEESLPASTELV